MAEQIPKNSTSNGNAEVHHAIIKAYFHIQKCLAHKNVCIDIHTISECNKRLLDQAKGSSILGPTVATSPS